MKKLALSFLLWASFAFAADTLEVFAIRVQFKEEIPDNSLTTGSGLFDSDKDTTNANYSLDPSGRRASAAYWRKHFEFINHYYQTVSNGKLVVEARIFPEKDQSAYSLDKYIIDYNRTAKKKDEKTAEFDAARSRDYMNFIWDALTKASESGDSPFAIAPPQSSTRKRAYMIIHAGSSRLLDGGSLGTNNANTPGDFTDVYVSADAWEYLDENDAERGKSRNGFVLENDTIRTVMVTSETASQDGLNWGINGVMVNQIGRELGLPDTYDVVKGISRLGYFDVMDFAGYNAGNGFFPVLPSAWLRAYLGWSPVHEVRPSAGGKVEVDLRAAGSGSGNEIIKVPLNASEYLLIENRQRSWNADGSVTVSLGSPQDDNTVTELTVPIDSLQTVFLDSICNPSTGKCTANRKKAKGIILALSSYDAGLPASGIAVWKVNDWYLKEALPFGVTNFWAGDTLRDHQFGIALAEADGILTIGKTFKNALGQETFDYGSGSDLIPHTRFGEKSPKDTVFRISSKGYGNTASTQGGYTGIQVSASVPQKYRAEKTSNTFVGDSVVNFAALSMKIAVAWDQSQIENSEFPKEVGLPAVPRNAVFMDPPSGLIAAAGEKLIVFGSENGTLQLMTARGKSLFDSDTAVAEQAVSSLKDTLKTVPLYRLGSPQGKLLGLASENGKIYSAHENTGLVITELFASLDQVSYQTKTLKLPKIRLGVMMTASGIWAASDKFLYRASAEPAWKDSVPFPKNFVPQDMAYCGEKNGEQIVFAGDSGKIALYQAAAGEIQILKPAFKKNGNTPSPAGQIFRLVCSDFDRDGTPDVFVLGSKGYGTMLRTSDASVLFEPKHYKRGGFVSGTGETSPPVVSDLNADGYPDIIFLGDNLVYAVDRSGVSLSGFPAEITRGLPEYGFLSEPLALDISGDGKPEILVGTNGGLLMAFTNQGKQIRQGFPLSAGSFEYGDTLYPMSLFAVNAIDSLSGTEVYAFHRNSVSGFRLNGAASGSTVSQTAWAEPGGSALRKNWFDASLLGEPLAPKVSETIGEFFLFPNPIRGGKANVRFSLGDAVKSAVIEFFDITGLCVYTQSLGELKQGSHQVDGMDISTLGSDIYSVRLKVRFASGKQKHKFYRVGVIR
ncbi:MAG: hypothetical protein LBR60_08110 [Fibrobacter sp.]|jgi:M6 family metalloprotease-like protein|nr:hypothetical protein [Fibrobacter sp.]